MRACLKSETCSGSGLHLHEVSFLFEIGLIDCLK